MTLQRLTADKKTWTFFVLLTSQFLFSSQYRCSSVRNGLGQRKLRPRGEPSIPSLLRMAAPLMLAFTSFFNFLLLPLPHHLSSFPGVCAAAHPCSQPQGNLRNHSCPSHFSDCPRGCPQTRGPALDSTEATPTCFSRRISAPTFSATGCVGWCFPRRPAALGPARGACSCSCGLPPTPSAPDAWPQPPRRSSSSSSSSHPTCKYY